MKYEHEHKHNEETVKKDFQNAGGGNLPTVSGNSSEPVNIHFGSILAWVLIRLVPASIFVYVIIRIFNLLFPV